METQENPNNSAPETEQLPTETPVAGNGTGETTAPETKPAEESFFDPTGLSPELQAAYKQMQGAFTKKMQGLSEAQKKAQSLDDLVAYEPFLNWYNQHRAGTDKPSPKQEALRENPNKEPAKAPEEMDPEVYAQIIQDPKKFNQYVKQLAMETAGPEIQKAKQVAEYTQNLMKVEKFGQEHPDFWELDRKGLMEPLIDKYPGLELEDYYKLAKYPFLEDEAIRKAHGVVQDKKNAVTEKPGAVIPQSRKVKVKSREEAMSLAWDARSRGEEPPDFDFE